jgi:DNA polymerase III subunit gamma/tau
MSYLVLARKWRPRSFAELAGQEHVQRALMNALESGRVHHAFLFTGTRGVGKTTIARILAKALNCETGVSATPCGHCSACREIDEGRFVDLIEVDAASRTKVDDTRELLDNVQYAPARGRFKVYLIDEVHMLSTHSFNALLKTLEEPPPHVKFLLATTDPQKLPVTVLSRCLQFNLKRLPIGLIVGRLTEIATAEGIEFEPEALRLVARAADGSMRDALSLLDQVIAFGGTRLTAADARTMLGTLDTSHVVTLLEHVASGDARSALECIAALDERVPDYRDVLGDVAALLQRVALRQAVPDLELDEDADPQAIERIATAMTPEDVQLNYQIALLGRRDLELAPDARSGFEMIVLRMFAFRLAAPGADASPGRARSTAPSARAKTPAKGDAVTTPAVKSPTQQSRGAADSSTDEWSGLLARLDLQGPASQLAQHCTLIERRGALFRLLLEADGEHFRRPQLEDKLVQALSQAIGEQARIEFELGRGAIDTPARRRTLDAEERLRAARAAIENDPNVRAMQQVFNATVQPDSVKPVN